MPSSNDDPFNDVPWQHDKTAEWKAAKRAAPQEEHPRNERQETLTECETRMIREHGIVAEREATRLAMYYEGGRNWPRDNHLIAFYRTIARLVRIDG